MTKAKKPTAKNIMNTINPISESGHLPGSLPEVPQYVLDIRKLAVQDAQTQIGKQVKKNKDKTLSVKITIKEFEQLQEIANSDSRNISSLIRLLIINLINGNIKITSYVQ